MNGKTFVQIPNQSNTCYPKVSLEEGSLHGNFITVSDTLVATTDGDLVNEDKEC